MDLPEGQRFKSSPATKLRRQVKDLAALPFWRTYLEPAPGSTVEARGCVIVGKSTGYSEARAGRIRFLCSKGRILARTSRRVAPRRGPDSDLTKGALEIGRRSTRLATSSIAPVPPLGVNDYSIAARTAENLYSVMQKDFCNSIGGQADIEVALGRLDK